jgi:hypothetical protein
VGPVHCGTFSEFERGGQESQRGVTFFRKGVQMKSEDIAKPSHYTGPIKVMTVPEVSSYLHVHPTTILQAAEAQSDSDLSRRQ